MYPHFGSKYGIMQITRQYTFKRRTLWDYKCNDILLLQQRLKFNNPKFNFSVNEIRIKSAKRDISNASVQFRNIFFFYTPCTMMGWVICLHNKPSILFVNKHKLFKKRWNYYALSLVLDSVILTCNWHALLFSLYN